MLVMPATFLYRDREWQKLSALVIAVNNFLRRKFGTDYGLSAEIILKNFAPLTNEHGLPRGLYLDRDQTEQNCATKDDFLQHANALVPAEWSRAVISAARQGVLIVELVADVDVCVRRGVKADGSSIDLRVYC